MHLLEKLKMTYAIDPLLSYLHFTDQSQETMIRVANAAFPFLKLYSPIAQHSAYAEAAVHLYTAIKERNVCKGMLPIFYSAISFLYPAQFKLCSHTMTLALSFKDLIFHCIEEDKKYTLIGQDMCHIVKAAAALGIAYGGGVYLNAFALLADMITEGLQSSREWKEGRYIEVFSHSLLAVVHAIILLPHLEEMGKRYYSQKSFVVRSPEEKIDQFIQEIDHKIKEQDKKDGSKADSEIYTGRLPDDYYMTKMKNPRLDLAKFLQEKGLPLQLSNIAFQYDQLSNVEACGIVFDSCKFDHISNTTFKDAIFLKCSWKKRTFQSCIFEQCYFEASNFKKSLFQSCRIIESIFQDCLLDSWYPMDTQIELSSFLNCQMQAAQLIFSAFKTCFFSNCDLSRTILHKNSDQIIIEDCKIRDPRQPIILMDGYLPNMEPFGGETQKALHGKGADVLLCSKAPSVFIPSLDEGKMVEEVKKGALQFQEDKHTSRVEAILELEEAPNIGKIRRAAKQLVDIADAVMMPGGSNVPELFYKTVLEPTGVQRKGIAYALFEFAVMYEAKKQKKPLFGVCRGIQMINVFCGGTLKDTSNGDVGYHVLNVVAQKTTSSMEKMFGSWIKGTPSYGYSCHWQAIDQMGKGVRPVLQFMDIIKAVAVDGLPWFGTQFHPENAWNGMTQIDNFILKRHMIAFIEATYKESMMFIQSMNKQQQLNALKGLKEMLTFARYNVEQQLQLFERFIELAKKRRGQDG